MDRCTRNYLIRRYALGPTLRIVTHLLAGIGLLLPAVPRRVRNPVFIVGCSRSGTTLFAEIFGAHEDVCNVMDTAQVWDLDYYDRDADDYRDESRATAWEGSRIRTTLGLRLLLSGRTRLVNKNNQNSLRLGFIRRLYPDARIVHVLRDARPVVLSNVSRTEKDGYRRRFPFGRFPKPLAWRDYRESPPDVPPLPADAADLLARWEAGTTGVPLSGSSVCSRSSGPSCFRNAVCPSTAPTTRCPIRMPR